MAEQMTLKEYAHHKKISFNTLVRIKTHYTNGMPASKISTRLGIYKEKIRAVIDWLKEREADNLKPKVMYALPIQYWVSEQEMEIQEYRIEDLTGEEKQIYEKL